MNPDYRDRQFKAVMRKIATMEKPMTPMSQQAAAAEMPRYRCHKEVWAFKIGAIERLEDVVRLAGQGHIVEVSETWVAKHSPGKGEWTLTLMLGGYYVRYKDGYASFSPADSFEEGYALSSTVGKDPCHGPCERAGWVDTAASFQRGADYYRGLLDRIATMLGEEAFTADDGSISDSPLRAKLPELVAARLRGGV